MKLGSYLRLHLLEPCGWNIPGVVRVKHQLHTLLLVFTVQFWIPVVVADQHSAADASNGEDAAVISRCVVREVARLPRPIPRAESLVVAIEDLAAMVYDIYAVVRLPTTREGVAGTEEYPDSERSGKAHDLL
jgi:hypothetical protein